MAVMAEHRNEVKEKTIKNENQEETILKKDQEEANTLQEANENRNRFIL